MELLKLRVGLFATLLGFLFVLSYLVSVAQSAFAAEDILIEDFEGEDYGRWIATADAFGSSPSPGTAGLQKEVSGFLGKGLANTYTAELMDEARGTLTSPPFTIERKHINFLIGGGRRPGGAELRLLLDDKPVRSQTGHANTTADQETLYWRNWDVADLAGKTARIEILDNIGGGWGHVLVDHIVQSDTPREDEIPAPVWPVQFPSPTPHQAFSETLPQQLEELKTNELMLRFAESRKRLAADPYRPAYHYANPESSMNDPNALVFWQGRWHLFFIAMPPDEFPNPADIMKRWHRTHIGHALSDDLIHWRDLPYAIYPGIEQACYSGGMLVEEDRVVAFYPGIGAGQMVAVSEDPLLLNWKKRGPVNSGIGDSCIWKEGDTYYGLTGTKVDYRANAWWPQMHLWASKDLVTWEPRGEFIENTKTPLTARYDDGACPNFKPIGEKHILTFFSHTNGGQYFLGDYDKTSHKFRPYQHGRFNHGSVAPGGVHAPSVVADGKGGVINILNINHGKHSDDWDQIMSLPQRLTLGPEKWLRIEPIAAVDALRGEHQHVGETVIPANREIVLEAIQGNTMELDVEIDPKTARWVQLNVLRSPGAEERTSITFYNYDKTLSFWYHTRGVVCLDGSRSSTLPDVWLRPPERAVMERGNETLKLRVFIDRSVVEVFVNGKQYLAMRVYPGRKDSLGVSLRAQGQDALLKSLDAWQMHSIYDD